MKPISRRRQFLFAVTAAIAILASSLGSASAAPILSIAPTSTTVQAGHTFSVDVSIADVTDLFAYQFDLGFDPAMFAGRLTFWHKLDRAGTIAP